MPAFDRVLSPQVIQLAVIQLVALILSICVHEFGHAYVADRLGDRLPRAQGRVTLNPLAHIDLIGTILFPLLAFGLSASDSSLGGRILGWGKPVQVSLSSRFLPKGMRVKTAHLLVALAGPLMNVLFAAVLSILYIVLLRTGMAEFALDGSRPLLPYHIGSVIQMNIGLAFFNMIPCPPLDGGAILAGLMSDHHPVVTFLEKYGQFIFLLLLFSGYLMLLTWPARFVSALWLEQLHRLVMQ